MQESFWWWQCSVRYSLPLPPPPGVVGPASNISSQTTRCWTSLTKQDQITMPPFRWGCDTQIWSSGRWNTCHYKTWQCPLLAPLVHGRQMVWECVCVCACVGTERTWSMHYISISTYQFILYYARTIHKHMHSSSNHLRTANWWG